MRVTRPVLHNVALRVGAAGEVGPGEQGLDRDPRLLHQLDPHPDLVFLLPDNLLRPRHKNK